MKLSRDLGLAGVAIGGHEQLAVRGLQLVHPEPAVSVTALSDVLPHRQREAPVPTCRSSRLNLGAVWKDELVSAQPLVRPAVGAPEPGCCIPGRVGRLQRGRGEPPTPATTISVATTSSPATTPSTVAAAHCSSSNASATASPSNRWSLDRVTTSHFRVNSGQPPASAFGGSLSRQSDIDPIPKVIHRKRYLRCADIDRKFALALLRHGRCKRI